MRLAALAVIVLVLVYSGQALLMAGLMLTAEAPLDYLRDNWEDIPRILLMGAVITLFISLATLAVSTFTTRRAIAAAIIIGGYILLNGVSDGLTFAENCIDQQAGFGDEVFIQEEDCDFLIGDYAPYVGLLHFGGVTDNVNAMVFDVEPQSPSALAVSELPDWTPIGAYLFWTVVARRGALEPLPEATPMTTESGATVEVQAISKWYGNVVAVNDMSFEIYPGVTGILGPNGAGKTTLLSMMCGLLRPSRGDVRVLGEEVVGNVGLYRRVGIMLEHDALYPFMTGRELRGAGGQAAGGYRPGGRGLGHLDGEPAGRAGPADGHVLAGHAAAHSAGGDHRARPRGAGAGRAAERHGPAAARRVRGIRRDG